MLCCVLCCSVFRASANQTQSSPIHDMWRPFALGTALVCSLLILTLHTRLAESASTFSQLSGVSGYPGYGGAQCITVYNSENANLPDGIYALGGFSGSTAGTYYRDLYYSGDGGQTWTTKTQMLRDRAMGVLYWIPLWDQLYLVGGRAASLDTNTRSYRYDGLTWWLATDNVFSSVSYFAAGGTLIESNNRIVFFGGYKDASYGPQSGAAYYSTDSGQTWTLRALSGTQCRAFVTCIYISPYALCIGGMQADGIYSQYVSSTTDGVTWNHSGTGGFSRRAGVALAVFNGQVFIMGGWDSSNTYLQDVWTASSNHQTGSQYSALAGGPWFSGRSPIVATVQPSVGPTFLLLGGTTSFNPNFAYTNTIWKYQFTDCLSAPCQLGGTCVQGINSYTCACVAGYSGLRCQTDINECASNPCRNGGTCIDGLNKFNCTCALHFVGALCETPVPPCGSNPCVAGNTLSCTDGVGYTCNCKSGFSGLLCQTNVNECTSNPCINGGTCIDGDNQFICICRAGYSGSICQTNINECASNPCRNGGTCSDELNGFVCFCPPTHGGAACENPNSPCASTPCMNGGSCTHNMIEFNCTCPVVYNGTLCQHYIPPCLSAPCVADNSVGCADAGPNFVCNCKSGYAGIIWYESDSVCSRFG